MKSTINTTPSLKKRNIITTDFWENGFSIAPNIFTNEEFDEIVNVLNDNNYDVFDKEVSFKTGRKVKLNTKFDTYATEEDPNWTLVIEILD